MGIITSFHNFGRFGAVRAETVVKLGESDDAQQQTFKYLSFRDAEDVEWQTRATESGPFDHYLAVDAQGVIVMMESDPDDIQVDGFDIIGIKVAPDFVHTRGPGGTIYGKIWNDGEILDPPEPVPGEISDRQFIQGLAKKGVITEEEAIAWVARGELPVMATTFIASLPSGQQFDANILLSGAKSYLRSHPIIPVFGAGFGWTSEQTDDFWRFCAVL